MAIANIKTKLKEDFSFIKNDGKVLSYLATELLSENNNDLQKTLDFIDTLCKKDVQTRMARIMNDLETAGEISLIIKDEIKKDNDKLEKVKKEIDELGRSNTRFIRNNRGLKDDKDKLEKTILELQTNFEKKQNEIKLEQDLQIEKIKKEMEIITNARDKLNTELTEIQSNIDNIFVNSYENEFDYEECDYVLTYDKDIYEYGNINHIHYLDISKFQSLVLPDREVLVSPGSPGNGFNDSRYEKTNLHLKFPITIKLFENEFIVKAYLENHNRQKYKRDRMYYQKYTNELSGEFSFGWYIIYITNYGRFIKSDVVYITYKNIEKPGMVLYDLKIVMETDIKELDKKYPIVFNGKNDKFNPIKTIPQDFPLIEALKLLYRMPRLFLDVIDAFHTQNNDLMQDCCKKYLSIARAKGTEKDIIDNIEYDRTIQNKDSIIIEKNKIIETQNEIIEKQKEDIEKMKLEIAKLKSALKVLSS